ncbi:MAG: glucose-6-phosphate isomerase [Bacilli bacterium]|nr:glucose-6-phosphate isomerase [Bacilli bacterium]
MSKLKLDLKCINNFVKDSEIKALAPVAKTAFHTLMEKTGAGNDFLGWIDFASKYTEAEINDIVNTANDLASKAKVLVVIGIGGSYLGAKAVISALKPYYKKDGELEVIFVGNSLSSTYIKETLDYLEDKDFCINVISKSGTTTEPAIAFRLFKELLIKKYGKNYASRIVATTDKARGALRQEANEAGYKTFIVPDDIGGRYSFLTPVGLLPIAASGIDIKALLKGINLAYNDLTKDDSLNNQAVLYATARNVLYRKGKVIEALVTYEPKVKYLSEWWKQLYGESEGKDGKGLYPASVVYSTDLHSIGQFFQEGTRTMFETIVNIVNPDANVIVNHDDANLDGLNYLEGRDVNYVKDMATLGTKLAHVSGGVPNIVISIDKLDEENFGYLLYFFMISCGISGYILGINPFNQPGVEAYKKNMFALLGKPGYEELAKELAKQLD